MNLLHEYQSTWPATAAGPPPPRPPRLGFFRELPALIVVAFVLAVLMKTFLIQAFFIPSESMVPTLLVGDRVVVNKLAYRFREPRRGEVIVFIAKHGVEDRSLLVRIKHFFGEGIGLFRPSETDFIKRVIGLPGDTIQVNSTGVTVTSPDGKKMRLTEPYIFSRSEQGPDQAPFKVPAGEYFVMGDNRANSADSRSSLGPVQRADIIGKAFVKIWPIKRIGILHVPAYQRSARALPFGAPRSSVAMLAMLAMIAAVRRRR
jgi:signal peptidase I